TSVASTASAAVGLPMNWPGSSQVANCCGTIVAPPVAEIVPLLTTATVALPTSASSPTSGSSSPASISIVTPLPPCAVFTTLPVLTKVSVLSPLTSLSISRAAWPPNMILPKVVGSAGYPAPVIVPSLVTAAVVVSISNPTLPSISPVLTNE